MEKLETSERSERKANEERKKALIDVQNKSGAAEKALESAKNLEDQKLKLYKIR